MKDCTYLGTLLTNENELRPQVEKNYECKQSMLCTSASTKGAINTQSRKNKYL